MPFVFDFVQICCNENFHSTVDRTTGFRSSRSEPESQSSPIFFNFNIKVLIIAFLNARLGTPEVEESSLHGNFFMFSNVLCIVRRLLSQNTGFVRFSLRYFDKMVPVYRKFVRFPLIGNSSTISRLFQKIVKSFLTVS